MSEGPDVGVRVERGAARAVLRNDSFRNLLLASVTSSVGDWIGLFALISLAETLAGTTRIGALAVSFVMIARIVPTLFLAPFAGVFVDRWDRKRTMIATDVVRGAVMLGVAFVGDAFQLVLATFVVETAAAMFIPAKDATVPTIVERSRLVQANQLSLLSTYSTLPLGALLCALVISATERITALNSVIVRFPDVAAFLSDRPEAVPIILNALTFFGSIVFLRRMVVPDDHVAAYEQRAESVNAFTELKDGLAFIAGMPLIRALVVGIMAAFLAAGAVIGVGEFFATILNAGDAGFATLGFVVGMGLVFGIISSAPLSRHIAKERLFAPGIAVAGVMLVVAALMPTLLLASLPAFLMGWGAGVSFILGYTMLQEYSEDEVRGRIFATFNTAVRAALFAALVIGPLTITVLGVERTSAQIATGEEVAIDDLEETTGTRYPYQIGGVRITLIMAGLTAAAGAVWTGTSIAGVLRGRLAVGRDQRTPESAGGPDPDGVPPAPRGLFVVFEGGEGAGKSTQVDLLREAVEARELDVVVSREPGGTPTGEAIRAVLLDAEGRVTPRTEALLYAAARAQHAADVLAPAVDRGAVVLCDRYIDSSIAYQGVGRALGTGIIADLNRWSTAELVPDLTILLDIPAEEGLARARDVDEPDRLESAGLAFHEEVNAAFRHRARREPDRYLLLDAREPVDLLQHRIRERVFELLVEHGLWEPPPPAAEASEEPTDATPVEAPDEASDDAPDEGGPVELDGTTEPLFEDAPHRVDDPVQAPAADPVTDPATDPDLDADGRPAVPAWLALPDEPEYGTEPGEVRS